MDKWILLGLLEAATVMTVASLWLLWRAYKLRQQPPSADDSSELEKPDALAESSIATTDADIPDEEHRYKQFALELEAQANQAVDQWNH